MNTLKKLASVISSLTREKEHNKIRVCPVCLSADIEERITGIAPVMYFCKRCGYKGYVVIEVGRSELQEIEDARRRVPHQ